MEAAAQEVTKEHAPKRTRAAVLRDSVKIRLATNEAGPAIGTILAQNGVDLPDCDWSTVFPHWLIATVEDEVIGCILVMPAKPFGFLEFLLVKPTVSFKLRAIALRKLSMQGAQTLAVFGSSYMFGNVDKSNANYMEIIKKNGFVRVCEGDVMVKRLR